MATILLQAAGAYLGGAFGAIGTAIGAAAGATVGYVLDTALINSTRHVEGSRLATARPFTAEEGASVTRIYGSARTGGTLIWATRFEETRQTQRQGFKGGPSVTNYSYFANAAFLLCEGEVAGLRRIWADGTEIDRTLYEIRVYTGTGNQPPDPLIEAKQGTGNAPAYLDAAYVVFERFPLADYGNRIPQFEFEVLRPQGDLRQRVRAVALIPGSTEYGLSPTPVTRSLKKGQTEAVNRHVLTAATDLAASLDELQMLCPNLQNVALVVAWFGNDLRAGECAIRPAVTQNDPAGLSQQWEVSGLARAQAVTVSLYAGASAYGGTPSDQSVMDAIAELRRRGLRVTLYPFVMMDIPTGNSLPDPYGAVRQAAYPWRGRITSMPAPDQTGTTDKTAAARSAIDAFCGDAVPGDFNAAGATIGFSGGDDWGYRRFVLHYARLALAAGGVETFLIGSELRGLTTLRDETGAFPFVEQLCALAGDARAMLGESTSITYGADWSEYFGYHPDDGSGDVCFHLDALWAHAAIDAVGIDNYMPLSDWRDADYGGGNPDGFAGPYDTASLRAAIAAGEGFDWFYESDADRRARRRTAISDGAYGKPWVFRYKDIAAWWSNLHYNRSGGVEASSPTEWAPQSKPVWFTELGCPAVDKGPNQPNVFPDPKSSENAIPYFSSGGRSDLAQQRFLDAHCGRWDADSPQFDASGNPVSTVYGGRMVDTSRFYLWAWDARPFPAFPLQSEVWADGPDWSLGHWLNGRLSSVAVADVIDGVVRDHGLPTADTAAADGFVAGYVVADPTSARSSLQPVVDLFGISAREDAATLTFANEGTLAPLPYSVEEMVVADDTPTFGTTRDPDHDLPAVESLAFQDPLLDYQTASARAVRTGAFGVSEETIDFPGQLETGAATALAADRLRRTWQGRDQVTFSVPPNRVEPAVGSIVRLPGTPGDPDYLVTQIDEGLVRKVTARRIARVAPVPWLASLPPPPVSASAVFGPPLALFLDLPMTTDTASPQDQFRAALWSAPWKTELLYASPEGTGFTRRATIDLPAVTGQIVDPVAGGFEGRIDEATVLTVKLDDGELASVSQLQMLNGQNIAALLSSSGTWEMIQFQDAEEISASVWRLSVLLRGQLGTNDAMTAGAAAGAAFVLIDEAVRPAGLLPGEAGLTLNWKAGPSGYDFGGPAFDTSTQTGGVRAQMPLSPVHLRAAPNAGGDWSVTWIRRGRVDADSWLGPDIPLGEEYEAYQIDIGRPEGGVVRSETVSQPSYLYGAAAMASDFGASPETIAIAVRQISAAVGPGIAASRTFSLL